MDHFSIVLKKNGEYWIISDEAHTIMHMSYDMDISVLKKGNRQKIITNTLSNFGIDENNGTLSIKAKQENLGNAFYNFIQDLVKITDLSYLSKEQVCSTFYEDFRSLLIENVEPDRLSFDYTHPEHDKEGKYIVDCRINGMPKPIYLFAIPNYSKCKDVMISMYQFEHSDLSFRFDNKTSEQRKIKCGYAHFKEFDDVKYRQVATVGELDSE